MPAVCTACGDEARVGGRYRLDEVVGQGASGTVYRGVDVDSGASVAVKEMAFRMGGDDKARALVEREGRVLRQLRHAGIPRWIDEVVAGTGRARALFLVQEFIEGTSLADELAEHRWSESEVLDLMGEVLPILDYLHTRHPPVIHRDLKPGNLLRRTDGSLALVDFGAVRDVLATARMGGSTVAGTFGYMAPEQFRGHAEPATDLYALGVTVVALLSRQDPAVLHDRAGRLAWSSAVAVSPGMGALLGALLAPDPGARPDTASAVLRWVVALRDGDARAVPRASAAAVRPAPPAPDLLEPDRFLDDDALPLRPSPVRAPVAAPLPPVFEPPARPTPSAPTSRGRAPAARTDSNRVVLLMSVLSILLLSGLAAGFVFFTAAAPVPAPPVPAPPREMPVPEVRPVPELQGNTLVPPPELSGTSRCIMLGGELGAHRDALPVAPGSGLVLTQPAISYPEGVGAVGDEHTCALRFAVDPTGRPAEVGISTEGCPDAFQAQVCDSANEWRFAAPASAVDDGGFIAFSRVTFRKR